MNEKFEKWWERSTHPEDLAHNSITKSKAERAFLAGAAAMRERAADECEAMMMNVGGKEPSAKHQNVWLAAAAIRVLEVE